MLTDPVADYLTRIRNAIQKRFDTVDMPKSNFKVEISKILKQEGYIVDFENAKDQKKPTLRIKLKYKDGLSVISELRKRLTEKDTRATCRSKSPAAWPS